MNDVAVVITAGGKVDGDFARACGTTVKALAPFGRETMLDRIVGAARAAGAARIAVVGDDEVRAHLGARVEHVIAAAESGTENVARALAAWPGERLLYLTSDIPFATGAAIAAFVAKSAGCGAAMALADDAAYRAAYPGAPEHSVKLGAERFANGSAFVLAPDVAERAVALAQRFFTARKSLVRMAMILGPALIARYAVKRLTVADIEARADRDLGGPCRGIRDASPALCFDVDDVADYRYALRHIAGARAT
jgi:molybdopterin-guanine dinucleotide biosynthesis protein A